MKGLILQIPQTKVKRFSADKFKAPTDYFILGMNGRAPIKENVSMNILCLFMLVALLDWNSAHAQDGFVVNELEPLPEFDCVIEPSEIVDIGSPVPGVIGAIYVNRSDTVAKGSIVAELESSVEYATVVLSKARADLTTSINLRQESAGFGARTRERNQTLFQQAAISMQDIDKLDTESRIAQLQIRQEKDNKSIAELEYERARAILNKHTIRTPVAGVVMERFKTVGEYVENDPLLRIAQLDPLHVEVILPIEYLGRLVPGQKAKVLTVLPGSTEHLATVTRVDQVADAASGTFGTRLSLPNPERKLPSGIRCKLAFLPYEEPTSIASADLELADEIYSDVVSDVTAEQNDDVADEVSHVATQEHDDVSAENHNDVIDEVSNDAVAELNNNVGDDVRSDVLDEIPAVPAEIQTFSEIKRSEILEDHFGDRVQKGEECYKIGPFRDKAIASRIPEALSDKPNEFTVDTTYVSTLYQVISSQQEDLSTQELLKHLANAGIEDAYIVKGGPHVGRISLGLHSVEAYAFNRAENLAAIQINTDIVELTREETAFWLNISLSNDPESNSELKSLTASTAPHANILPTSCDQLQAHISKENSNPDPLPDSETDPTFVLQTESPATNEISDEFASVIFGIIQNNQMDQTGLEVQSDPINETAPSADISSLGTNDQFSAEECYEIGPFNNEALASRLSSSLRNSANRFAVDARYESQSLFRVLVSPQEHDRATLNLLEHLQNLGVKDIGIVRTGDYRGRITLGIYSVEENAVNRAQSYESTLISIEIIEVIRAKQPSFWLNLSLTSSPEAEAELNSATASIAPNANVLLTSCEQLHADSILRGERMPPQSPLACINCMYFTGFRGL